MKIVFLGSPEYAVPSLKAIIEAGHEVVGVVTQPDAPCGRGHKLAACPVKNFAIGNGLKHLEYEKISRDGVDDLKALHPDLMITVAYGQILSGEILAIPTKGTINAHGSLLPKYRGASPIQAAVAAGEIKTGVSIMRTELGLDTGPVILTKITEIGEEETAGELSKRLAALSAEALVEVLKQIENGQVKYTPQDDAKATISKKITKNDAVINWGRNAHAIKCQILSQNPNPVSRTVIDGVQMKVFRARETRYANTNFECGTVIEPTSSKNGVFVQCGDGILELVEVCLPGGKAMPAKNLVMSNKISVGSKFEVYAFDSATEIKL